MEFSDKTVICLDQKSKQMLAGICGSGIVKKLIWSQYGESDTFVALTDLGLAVW